MKKTTKQILAENLQSQLDIRQMTQTDLANAIGVTPAAVSTWVKGTAAPHANTLDKICKYFNLSKAELIRDYGNEDRLASSKVIPIYHSIYRDNKYFDESNVERYVAVDQSVQADFGIIVYSESMSDLGINPGDIAFFTKDYTFVDGHIYAVWITGKDSVILKKVYYQRNSFVLISENINEEPVIVDHTDAFIVGELFGIYKEWKWNR